MGWAIWSSNDEYEALTWEQEELDIIAGHAWRFEPENRSVNIPSIAILLDPKIEQVEYNLASFKSRSHDRNNFYDVLYESGLKIDPIGVSEVFSEPQILDDYTGIVVSNLARFDTSVAQTLHDFAQKKGGGLFIAGRTGIFDSSGNSDYTSLKMVLGLNSTPQDDGTLYTTWSFDANDDDPLLLDLAGLVADTANYYYIPTADWSDEGYAELGYTDVSGNTTTIIAKDKTVVWFPRIYNIDDEENLVTLFFQNWELLLTGP